MFSRAASGSHRLQRLREIGRRVIVRFFRGNQLSITAIFRDEARYLDEWVRFHVHQGVTKFFLYDDRSADSPETVLSPWIRQGFVVLRQARPGDQEATYNLSLKQNRWKTRWMAFIDIDEFLFSPTGEKLTSLLPVRSKITGFFVFWTLFGTSGHVHPPAKGVLEGYTKSLPLPSTQDELLTIKSAFKRVAGDVPLTGNPYNGKSIVNPRRVREMGVHFPRLYRGSLVDEAGAPLPNPFSINALESSDLPFRANKILRINHYWSKSQGDLERKVARPNVSRRMREQFPQPTRLSTFLEWGSFLNQESDLTLLRHWRGIVGPFIFIIGFNKTGTRSLAHFFSANGLPAVHWDENRLVERMVKNIEQGNRIFAGYDSQFRVFSDLISVSNERKIEGNRFFKEMDRDYPESLFILNNRDTEDWVASRARHAKGSFLTRQLEILGSSNPDDAFALWRAEKADHEMAVRDYFAGSDRLLELQIDAPDVPREISAFVGLEMDSREWGHLGRSIEA
jgi:hypothetical protein